jgi:FkbM family methyltransferase
MNWQRIKGKLSAAWHLMQGRVYASGSQAGEDQLIRYLFYSCLGIQRPTYLDIGANHPFKCNNTFFFYNRGSKGVCMEPDPAFSGLLKKHRSRDTILEAGVGLTTTTAAALYVFDEPYSGWNTFSQEEAEHRVKESGVAYSRVISVPLININEVIATHFDRCPNLLSLDVEGLDLQILQSLDFERFAPEVICVETICFGVTNHVEKVTDIPAFLHSKGYFTFGDTHVNTIFCRRDVFNQSRS